MKWTEETFKTGKPIIALVHLQPLPGDPLYDARGGMDKVIRMAREDVEALQNGGVDGLLFSNEYSLPYLSEAPNETVAAMAYIIGALKPIIRLPYGNDCINDALASISLAAATGAVFTRGVYHGAWAEAHGVSFGRAGEAFRLRHNLGLDHFKLVYYLVPESSSDLGNRDPLDVIKPVDFLDQPDGYAVAGYVAGQKPDVKILQKCRSAFPNAVFFASTGVTIDNVGDYLPVSDGAFIGTSFKKDGRFRNQVDGERVRAFMEKVRSLRG